MFLLDTADLSEIKEALELFPIAGVTTNPSILAKVASPDIRKHLQQIAALLSPEQSLHIQLISQEKEAMLAEAAHLVAIFGKQVYLKVPVTEVGLSVIKELKKSQYHVTATAIYSEIQGYLAIAAGADYLAPYYNRMENLGIDAREVITNLANRIAQLGSTSKILGASYKNSAQVTATFAAGGHCVTVAPQLLKEAVSTAPIQQAIATFTNDWQKAYGDKQI